VKFHPFLVEIKLNEDGLALCSRLISQQYALYLSIFEKFHSAFSLPISGRQRIS